MELILLNDGVYHLVEVTKEMTKGIKLLSEINCFDLCDILRIYFIPNFCGLISPGVNNNINNSIIIFILLVLGSYYLPSVCNQRGRLTNH